MKKRKEPDEHVHDYVLQDDDTQLCDCSARQWKDGSDLSFPHPDARQDPASTPEPANLLEH